jgi:hypothetical protein
VAPGAEQIVVCVGSQAIAGASYLHWLAVAEKVAVPGKGERAPTATELRHEVLEYLISAEWLRLEANALGIHVTKAAVKREFAHLCAQQFPRHREFEAFLRESGQSVADLLERVEATPLSLRILNRVQAGHHSARSKERATARFVKAFNVRWRPQTYCASEYAVADCGHVQGAG